MNTNEALMIEYEKVLKEFFEQELPKMKQRLRLIRKYEIGHGHPVLSLIAAHYLREACHSYLHGNYIAFLAMLSFTFEVLFRAAFDIKKFKDLIDYALQNDIINKRECQEIHWLRNFRNGLSHVVDQIHSPPRKRYNIDFYYGTTDDIEKMANRGFKLIPIINRIQLNSVIIKHELRSKGKMRPLPSVDDLQKLADEYSTKNSKHKNN